MLSILAMDVDFVIFFSSSLAMEVPVLILKQSGRLQYPNPYEDATVVPFVFVFVSLSPLHLYDPRLIGSSFISKLDS